VAYTLDELANDCKQALQSDQGRGGREKVRECLQRALRDEGFLATHLGPEVTRERDVIYEDPQLGFCICAHVYGGAKGGTPHDHGPTWAIYGQAEGETEMTDWQIVEPPADGRPGKVAQVKTYRLRPGDAHIYEVGDVHAPMREAPTKLIRIEGRNTESIERTPLEPAS
jgi:hypothetical protein